MDIDIYITAPEGRRLVGRIKNNVVDDAVTQGVLLRVDSDKKYFYFPYDGEYTIELTGTDAGTMKFFFAGNGSGHW